MTRNFKGRVLEMGTDSPIEDFPDNVEHFFIINNHISHWSPQWRNVKIFHRIRRVVRDMNIEDVVYCRVKWQNGRWELISIKMFD